MSCRENSKNEKHQNNETRLRVLCCVFAVLMFFALMDHNHKNTLLRQANKERVEAEIIASKSIAESVADHGYWYETWQQGHIVRDVWGVDLVIREAPESYFTIEVKSAGPDLTFSTPDDITVERNSPNLIVEKIPEKIHNMEKEIYLLARKRIFGKQKEHPNAVDVRSNQR